MNFERLENRNMFCSGVVMADEVMPVGDLTGDGKDDLLIYRENRDAYYAVGLDNQIERINLPEPTNDPWDTKIINLGDIDRDGKADLAVKYRGNNIQFGFLGNFDTSIIGPKRLSRLLDDSSYQIDYDVNPYGQWDYDNDGSPDTLCTDGNLTGITLGEPRAQAESAPKLFLSIEDNFIYLNGTADEIFGFDIYSKDGTLEVLEDSPLTFRARFNSEPNEVIIRHYDEFVSLDGKASLGVRYTGSLENLHVEYHHEATRTSNLVKGIQGDSNLDGATDFADFLALSRHFGKTVDAEVDAAMCDFDGTGRIDFGDFLILSENFGA